ncbi:MAG: hypothetical protein OEY64_11350 [Nitrospinota bacterium]|nr:hypothetical protein [Nitrospinota bacterium]
MTENNKIRIIMDLCFDEGPFYIELGKKLRDVHGWDVSMLTMGRRWRGEAKKKGFRTFNVGEHVAENFNAIPTDMETLKKLESKYGDPVITSQVYGDRFFSMREHNAVAKWTVGQYMFLEKVFDEVKPDVFLIPGTAHALHIFIERVCKARGVQYLSAYDGRVISRLIFSTEYVETWEHASDIFREKMEKGLSEEDRNWAKNWLGDFRQGKLKPYYMGIAWQKPALRFQFLREFVARLYRVFLLGHGGKDDYVTPNPFYSAYKNILVILKRLYLKYVNHFEMPVKGEKYLFFPLHFQPEATTIICAPEFVDQLAFVENISRSIPMGYRLYVKEHPNSIGKRPRGYYKRLKDNFNVRLIDPSASGREMIEGAEIVINLTGTAGLEAAILGKKVLNCGLPPFRDTPFFSFTRDPSMFKEVISDMLSKPDSYDEKSVMAYLVAIRDSSYDGLHNLPHQFPYVMREENIAGVANGIKAEYEYFVRKKRG